MFSLCFVDLAAYFNKQVKLYTISIALSTPTNNVVKRSFIKSILLVILAP